MDKEEEIMDNLKDFLRSEKRKTQEAVKLMNDREGQINRLQLKVTQLETDNATFKDSIDSFKKAFGDLEVIKHG